MTWLEISEAAKQFWPAWLMLVFLGIAFYAFRPKNREHFAECAKIPFKDERDEHKGPNSSIGGA